ncbi:hypothetical protein [Aureimonas sp. AU40]|uniref:hypothetical protein n=1 Tax=Aureimonas sp. AU40 TaxID=1637747 RepID=UPI0007861F05|nr:hypothetical protein [Aureimonas sp. AU40]
MKVRLIGGVVVELSDDPASKFHPDIAKEFVAVPKGVPEGFGVGYRLEGKNWIAPLASASADQAEPEPAFRLKLTPSEFRNAFSAFEEVAIVEFSAGQSESDSAEQKTLRKVIGVFFDRIKDPHLTTVDLTDPRNLAGLDILVSVGILTPERREVIARGLPG